LLKNRHIYIVSAGQVVGYFGPGNRSAGFYIPAHPDVFKSDNHSVSIAFAEEERGYPGSVFGNTVGAFAGNIAPAAIVVVPG